MGKLTPENSHIDIPDVNRFREADDTIAALRDENTALRSRIEELERELERFRSERSYVVGFNDGWENAIEEAGAWLDAQAAVILRENHAIIEDGGWPDSNRTRKSEMFRRAASAVRALGKERT